MEEQELYIYKLAKAIYTNDKKQRDAILVKLRELGIDSSTALSLAVNRVAK